MPHERRWIEELIPGTPLEVVAFERDDQRIACRLTGGRVVRRRVIAGPEFGVPHEVIDIDGTLEVNDGGVR